jgi:hypothetical protein
MLSSKKFLQILGIDDVIVLIILVEGNAAESVTIRIHRECSSDRDLHYYSWSEIL